MASGFRFSQPVCESLEVGLALDLFGQCPNPAGVTVSLKSATLCLGPVMSVLADLVQGGCNPRAAFVGQKQELFVFLEHFCIQL